MIDVSGKEVVERIAEAEGFIELGKESVERIKSGKVEKGDVFEAAKIAAIQAVKKTPELLPYCHPLPIEHVKVDFELEERGVRVKVRVKTHAKTGVEMEALTGVMAALLCIWDMVKRYEKDESGNYPGTRISGVRVVRKLKSVNA